MPFQKGHKFGKGRPAGKLNASTEAAKLTLARLASKGLDNISEDIDKIRKNNPVKAAEIYLKLMDFALPRMKSVDMEVKGEISAKIDKLQIEVIQSDGSKDKNK
jgi:hypothetical protein